MTKRQILVELDVADDDRLISITTELMEHIERAWGHSATAEAFLAGKKALGFYPPQLEMLQAALTYSQDHVGEQLEYANKHSHEYDDGEIEGMEEQFEKLQELDSHLEEELRIA